MSRINPNANIVRMNPYHNHSQTIFRIPVLKTTKEVLKGQEITVYYSGNSYLPVSTTCPMTISHFFLVLMTMGVVELIISILFTTVVIVGVNLGHLRHRLRHRRHHRHLH